MRTITRMKPSGLLALAIVLIAPTLASAQLLPNLPLRRREKPDCAHENPQYRTIRQEYWGYYPTCWRKFPAGWGCPSPEAPNWEAYKKQPGIPAFADLNRDATAAPARGAPGDSDAPPVDNAPGATDPNAKPKDADFPPLAPDAPSPFDTTPKPPVMPPDPKPSADKPPGANDPGTASAAPRRRTLASAFSRRR